MWNLKLLLWANTSMDKELKEDIWNVSRKKSPNSSSIRAIQLEPMTKRQQHPDVYLERAHSYQRWNKSLPGQPSHSVRATCTDRMMSANQQLWGLLMLCDNSKCQLAISQFTYMFLGMLPVSAFLLITMLRKLSLGQFSDHWVPCNF